MDDCIKALKELDEYKKQVEPKLMEVCRRLAEIGAQEARAHMVLANGNTNAMVSEPIPIKNGYKFSLEGHDAYFIEFGTGDATNAHGYMTTVPVYPGSYSEQNAKKYSTYGFWYYSKVKYTETPAYMPIYYAGLAIRNNARRVVKEVFNQ